MHQFTQQQLEERFAKLPPALKDAMTDEEVTKKMLDIGKKFGLNIEKTGFLSGETGYLVLGLTHPSEFVGNLVSALEVNRDKAREIASEVNHQILFGLREALKTAHQIDVNEEEFQKEPVAPARPLQTPLTSTSAVPPINLRSPEKPDDIPAPKPIPPASQPQAKPSISLPPLPQKPRPDFAPQNLGGQARPAVPPLQPTQKVPPAPQEKPPMPASVPQTPRPPRPKPPPIVIPPLGRQQTIAEESQSIPAPKPKLAVPEPQPLMSYPFKKEEKPAAAAEPGPRPIDLRSSALKPHEAPQAPKIPPQKNGDPYREPIE